MFKRALGRWATGVTVASVFGADGLPYGLTVSSFSSLSLDPPLVMIAIDHQASTLPHFRGNDRWAVSILSEAQQSISVRFARKPAKERFQGVAWRTGQTGAPVLEGALATLECLSHQVVDAGDHAIFIGRVLAAKTHHGAPLLYFGGDYRRMAGQP